VSGAPHALGVWSDRTHHNPTTASFLWLGVILAVIVAVPIVAATGTVRLVRRVRRR
jgi:hypothetical protein